MLQRTLVLFGKALLLGLQLLGDSSPALFVYCQWKQMLNLFEQQCLHFCNILSCSLKTLCWGFIGWRNPPWWWSFSSFESVSSNNGSSPSSLPPFGSFQFLSRPGFLQWQRYKVGNQSGSVSSYRDDGFPATKCLEQILSFSTIFFVKSSLERAAMKPSLRFLESS